MSNRFVWTPNITRGKWLRPMAAEPLGSILSIVPCGFEMYARVFHPVERDRPRESQTWQGADEKTLFTSVQDFESFLETERATWAQTAASFGTIMHATAQYSRLLRREYGDSDGAIAPDGWRYGDSDEGRLDADSVATVAAVLSRHTTTPDAGTAAIWEGWGDLRREAATAPRFELHRNTGRGYVLFEAGANDFANASWPDHAPWVDDSRWSHSPSILWPDDHAWVLATEIDFDSTLVAGSAALIRELMQTPGLEVWPIGTDADLTRDGDDLNRFE